MIDQKNADRKLGKRKHDAQGVPPEVFLRLILKRKRELTGPKRKVLLLLLSLMMTTLLGMCLLLLSWYSGHRDSSQASFCV